MLLVTGTKAHAQMDRARYIQMSASIAKVEAVYPSGRLGLGTGVTVAEGWVATNCHVTRQADELYVVKGGVRFAVTALRVDALHDLCVLNAPQWRSKPVALGSSAWLERGQPVAGMGYIGGLELTLRLGSIVALHALDGAQVIQTDAPFTSGASGGGLFDEQGRLIGLMTFRLRGADHHYFVIPVDWLQALMQPLIQSLIQSHSAFEVAPVQTDFGPAFWQLPEAQQPYFLRAIPILKSHDWAGAALLADQWVMHEPHNAEGWFALGLAAKHTHSAAQLRQALNKLQTLAPSLADELALQAHGMLKSPKLQ